jgi:hypothetical protein
LLRHCRFEQLRQFNWKREVDRRILVTGNEVARAEIAPLYRLPGFPELVWFELSSQGPVVQQGTSCRVPSFVESRIARLWSMNGRPLSGEEKSASNDRNVGGSGHRSRSHRHFTRSCLARAIAPTTTRTDNRITG